MLITNSGEVWIGNGWKIFCYNPDQKAFYSDPIQVSIQKVWARDSLIYQNLAKESVQILPFTFNNLKFQFLCSFLEEPEKTLYQYKLDGFENKWSDWTRNKEAVFTNLHEGSYTFYVKAKNIYDVTSEPVAFTFRVAPPWYRSHIAYIIYFILLSIFFYLFIQFKIGRVKRRQSFLEGVIKEKTKELTDANEELLSQSNLLSEQNHQLQDAQVTIENQNKEIKNRNETLEIEVHKRTKELVKYNQQLEQFAFVTAHNLRGPVARILGLGTVLDMTENVTEEVRTITEKLVFTTREIDSVIADLNHILHIKNTPSLLEELNFETEISRVISGLAKDIEHTNAIIRIDFSEVPSVITSQAYLYSIVYQLLSNALKFRHPERIPEIRITTVNTEDYICFSVSDNGLGIELPKFKEKLFTLYGRFHLHVEGKGMGLYLAQTQILALGGNIEVKSEVNIGTTFEVFFKKIQKV
jgi:signal transduction histidine kinase